MLGVCRRDVEGYRDDFQEVYIVVEQEIRNNLNALGRGEHMRVYGS